MDKLRLLWLEPQVQFKGKGIITAWREAMERQGWAFTQSIDEADCVFFGSDSQLIPELLGKKPTILYFWGWLPSRFLDRNFHNYAKQQLQLMAQCTRILVPSPTVMEQVFCFGLPCQVCLPGVDLHLIDSVVCDLPRDPRVVFISRLVEHKGLDMLIQAMSIIDPQPKLLICGSGEPHMVQYYKDMCTALAVKAEFIEPNDEEKIRLLKTSSVLVHPSVYEGFGLPVLESLACMTPVIAFNTPQMRWLLQEDAYFFDSIEGLAGQIIHVLQKPGEARERTWRGHERVRKSLTLDHASTRLWPHIHMAIKEHLGLEIRQYPMEAGRIYDAEHKRNWNYSIDRFDPTWERHWRAQSFIKALKECNAHDILDIGCGAVYPTIFARAGFHVTAVDISEECLKQVKAVAEMWDVSDKIVTHRLDAGQLPELWSNRFDAVVQGELWEHVPDVRRVIDEGLRVLKPAGYLIASTPIGTHHYDPMHIRVFNDETIQELLAPYNVKKLDRIAEEGTEPSCYLVILEKTQGR